MKIEKITLHKMRTVTGQEAEYVRVFGKIGITLIKQTLMPYRLTADQLAMARSGLHPQA